MKSKLSMCVTITLAFSDECHREAWLEQEGIVSLKLPDKNDSGEYVIPDSLSPEERSALLKRVDYERRKGNIDLLYEVGPVSRPRPHGTYVSATTGARSVGVACGGLRDDGSRCAWDLVQGDCPDHATPITTGTET